MCKSFNEKKKKVVIHQYCLLSIQILNQTFSVPCPAVLETNVHFICNYTQITILCHWQSSMTNQQLLTKHFWLSEYSSSSIQEEIYLEQVAINAANKCRSKLCISIMNKRCSIACIKCYYALQLYSRRFARHQQAGQQAWLEK